MGEKISVRFVLSCAQDAFFWTLSTFALLTLILAMAWIFVAIWLRAAEVLKRETVKAPKEKAPETKQQDE